MKSNVHFAMPTYAKVLIAIIGLFCLLGVVLIWMSVSAIYTKNTTIWGPALRSDAVNTVNGIVILVGVGICFGSLRAIKMKIDQYKPQPPSKV